MKFFLPIIFLLGISRTVFGIGIRRERSNNDDELSYQELINMNVSCYPLDSCTQNRTDDPPIPTLGLKCSCHSQCWEYGTCCIDSPYRVKRPIQECVSTRDRSYYMVYRCPDNTHPNSIWRNHCESELNGIDDILMMTPVTSLDTSRTYKNYYCFRCHESTNKYVSWNLEVSSGCDAPNGTSIHSLAYNKTENTWVAILDESHISLPVRMSFVFPHNVQAEPIACNTINFIADCFLSADERLNAKCLAYSAIVYKKFLSYKNVHCALCRYESLVDLTCNPDASGEEGGTGYPGGSGSGGSIDVFRCMMDINGGGEDKKCFKKYDKPEKCEGDYHVWNPFTKKCQKTVCICPGYVPKNGICVKP